MAYIIGIAVIVHRNGYQGVVGFINVFLVLRLSIEQGIEGTSAILSHFIERNGIQQRPSRIGILIHQCLSTMQRFGYVFVVVAPHQEKQRQQQIR